MSIHRIYAGISASLVLIALIWGFVLVGSPVSSRQERYDDRRLQDLNLINQAIWNHVYDGRPWEVPTDGSLRRPLPDSLQTMADQVTGQRLNLTDPQTNNPYAYTVTGITTYELCATFNAMRDDPYDVFWNHGAGKTCFLFDALRAQGYGGGELLNAVPLKSN